MKETYWVLDTGASLWNFSTEKMAKTAQEFFDLDDDECEIYENTFTLDDEEILRRMKRCGFKIGG